MRVFISWSGAPSQKVAKALAAFLRRTIQSVIPFLSSEDIRNGQRWQNEIGAHLQDTRFGILCLTPDNKEKPWILFEAGALSKSVEQSRVVPLLIGLHNAEIAPPLSQFQTTGVEKDHIFKLVKDINALVERSIEEETLKDTFEAFWQPLGSAIQEAQTEIKKPAERKPQRSPDEMTEEILTTVRSLAANVEQLKVSRTSSDSTEMDWLKWAKKDPGKHRYFHISDDDDSKIPLIDVLKIIEDTKTDPSSGSSAKETIDVAKMYKELLEKKKK